MVWRNACREQRPQHVRIAAQNGLREQREGRNI
jgi:hypothetical protein